MAIIKVKTKNNVNIDKKSRVYFTCHPDDFDKFFERICDDIFKTHDCAIYYTENMTDVISEENKETDLGRYNLFVVPVTLKLIQTHNRAMDDDISYALKEHIPILPIVMEKEFDKIYSEPNRLREIQFLNPNSHDPTEIPYEEKLEKYLESVLVCDRMAKRIRASFDAYIFLSYRKKDRRYANELMRLIHKVPECRNIAIWFDEFLTPGENFKEGIDKILHDSNLFVLLVTPNLLEEPNGNPNYVMSEEYPVARDSGIAILPAELVKTDETALMKKFEGLPNCVNPRNDETFRTHMSEVVARIDVESKNTPEYNFLIGLAYRDGIDVEVDRKRALELITAAAEAGWHEAMDELRRMYNTGIGVETDFKKAELWAKAHADYMVSYYSEMRPATFVSLINLAMTKNNIGKYKEASEILEDVCRRYSKVLGEEHPETLKSLGLLAFSYNGLGCYKKALELEKRVYRLRCKALGEEHPETLTSLSNLASYYGNSGELKKALKIKEKVYRFRCKQLGEEHPDTIISLNNLAYSYGELGDHRKALNFKEKAYTLHSKVLGEEHPNTLALLNNLAVTYGDLEEHEKALELKEKVYALCCKVLGEEHPLSLASLNNLAVTYSDLGEHEKALKFREKVYALFYKVLGAEHPNTIASLSNLASSYSDLGENKKALELKENVYILQCKVLGKNHPEAVKTLNFINKCKEKLSLKE